MSYGLTSDLIWWFLTFVQGIAFTWVSRARSGGSVAYAAVAATISHSVWFASQFYLVSAIYNVAKTHDWSRGIWVGFLYVTAMVLGQILMMRASMKYLEKGDRKIGVYKESR